MCFNIVVIKFISYNNIIFQKMSNHSIFSKKNRNIAMSSNICLGPNCEHSVLKKKTLHMRIKWKTEHKISAVTTDSPLVICCSAANRESPFPIGILERVAKKKRDGPDLHDHKAALCFAANTQLFRIPTFRIVCNHP